MFTVEKILCPADFGESSQKSLEAAIELSRLFSAELILMHTIRPLPISTNSSQADSNSDIPTVVDELWREARKRIDHLTANTVPDDIRCRSKIVPGKPAEEIVRLAKEEAADLIVIAMSGQSGWRRLLIGSIAEKVVRSAQCPVLTVRQSKD